MRRAGHRLLLVALLGLGLGGCLGGDDDAAPKPSRPPSRAITRAELLGHLAALQRIADRNGGNRSAGTRGYDQSADYVAARLAGAGWTVTSQDVPFTYFRVADASLAVDGRELTRADDFQVLSYSGSGRAAGRLRSAGLGCSPDDFTSLGHGEVPLVGRGGCFFRQKAANAQRAGAAALLVGEPVRSRRGVPSGTLAVPGTRIPVVLASTRALGREPAGRRVTVSVDAISRAGRTQNVIAETPGGNANKVVM